MLLQVHPSRSGSVRVSPSELAVGLVVGWWVPVVSGGTHPLPFLLMAGEAWCESWGDNEAGSWFMPFPFPLVVRLELPLESPEEEEEEGTQMTGHTLAFGQHLLLTNQPSFPTCFESSMMSKGQGMSQMYLDRDQTKRAEKETKESVKAKH